MIERMIIFNTESGMDVSARDLTMDRVEGWVQLGDRLTPIYCLPPGIYSERNDASVTAGQYADQRIWTSDRMERLDAAVKSISDDVKFIKEAIQVLVQQATDSSHIHQETSFENLARAKTEHVSMTAEAGPDTSPASTTGHTGLGTPRDGTVSKSSMKGEPPKVSESNRFSCTDLTEPLCEITILADHQKPWEVNISRPTDHRTKTGFVTHFDRAPLANYFGSVVTATKQLQQVADDRIVTRPIPPVSNLQGPGFVSRTCKSPSDVDYDKLSKPTSTEGTTTVANYQATANLSTKFRYEVGSSIDSAESKQANSPEDDQISHANLNDARSTDFVSSKSVVNTPKPDSKEKKGKTLFSNKGHCTSYVDVKIVKDEQSNSRVVMSSDRLLRTVTDHMINPNMHIVYSIKDEQTLSWGVVNPSGRMENLNCRFETPEIAAQFKEAFESCLKRTQTVPVSEANTTSTSANQLKNMSALAESLTRKMTTFDTNPNLSFENVSGSTSTTAANKVIAPVEAPPEHYTDATPVTLKFAGIDQFVFVPSCSHNDYCKMLNGKHKHLKPVVKLPDNVKLETGEENEDILYCQRATLFRFHDSQWKERGTGDVRLLRNKSSFKARLLMRRENTLKVCLNQNLTKGMTLLPVANAPGKAWLWHTIDFSRNTPVQETFAIIFRFEVTAAEFEKEFEAARDDTESVPKKPKTDTIGNTPPSFSSSKFSLGAGMFQYADQSKQEETFKQYPVTAFPSSSGTKTSLTSTTSFGTLAFKIPDESPKPDLGDFSFMTTSAERPSTSTAPKPNSHNFCLGTSTVVNKNEAETSAFSKPTAFGTANIRSPSGPVPDGFSLSTRVHCCKEGDDKPGWTPIKGVTKEEATSGENRISKPRNSIDFASDVVILGHSRPK